jgi:uncharacterized protein YbjT (DUF2867 family)
MLVTVIGGSGFIGRNIVRELAKQGHRVRVACRRPDLAGHVTTAGNIGQIALVQANIRFPESIIAAIQGADVVINCVGILCQSGRQSFTAVQARGAETVAKACAQVGAKLIHFSAIGADSHSKAAYAQSKAEGEQAVLAADARNLVLRPSLVFGPEDNFLNRFATLATRTPALPLIGENTKFQPVFVGDLASETVATLASDKTGIYELGGPDILTMREIMELLLKIIGRQRVLVPLPFPVASLLGQVLQYVPTQPLTADQVLMLQSDNIVTQNGLIGKARMQDIAPTYLWRFRKAGEFSPLGATQ